MLKPLMIVGATLILASPAIAGTIKPSQARGAQGQLVIVEGTAHVEDQQGTTKIELADDTGNRVAVTVPEGVKSALPQLSSYEGKTVDVTGVVQLTATGPGITISRAGQLKLASP